MEAEQGALTQGEIDQRVYDLYDEYCHGRIDRRAFLQRATYRSILIGGISLPSSGLAPNVGGKIPSRITSRAKAGDGYREATNVFTENQASSSYRR